MKRNLKSMCNSKTCTENECKRKSRNLLYFLKKKFIAQMY